jgi:flagellar biosynthesis protein FlhF
VILSNNAVEGGVEILALAGSDIAQLAQPVVNVSRRARTNSAHRDDNPLLAMARQNDATPMAALPPLQQSVASQPVVPQPTALEKAHGELAIARNVISEIKSLRGVVEDQLASLSWGELARRDPIKSRVMRELLRCSFSAQFARELVAKMPAGITAKAAPEWIRQALALNLHAVPAEHEIVNRGGVYALIGPTGVGKTTTTAKIAARGVVRYGADKVALLTTDGYRVGAHEQLRIYGKILGLTVHAVKDATDLNITLSELRGKHLVLIDTVGMSQRDQRVAEQVAMLSGAGAEVKRLLLLPATSSGETLEDVVRAASNQQTHGSRGISGCILSKIDEGVNLGGLLDVTMRHRLPVHYVANGQRVPEDLHLANVQYLLHRALRPEGDSVFSLQEAEVPLVMGANNSDHAHGAALA